MKRNHFKMNRICSSKDYEWSVRYHKEMCNDRWDILYEELNICTPYYYFFGKKIIIKNKLKRNEIMRQGFKIHFE